MNCPICNATLKMSSYSLEFNKISCKNNCFSGVVESYKPSLNVVMSYVCTVFKNDFKYKIIADLEGSKTMIRKYKNNEVDLIPGSFVKFDEFIPVSPKSFYQDLISKYKNL